MFVQHFSSGAFEHDTFPVSALDNTDSIFATTDAMRFFDRIRHKLVLSEQDNRVLLSVGLYVHEQSVSAQEHLMNAVNTTCLTLNPVVVTLVRALLAIDSVDEFINHVRFHMSYRTIK